MAKQAVHKVYFTDIFDISPEALDEYGAFNIALVNDLPLFIDPFLLFDSEDAKYRALHDEIISYLCFLRDRAVAGELTEGAISQWLLFKEVKQNWLGFSKTGNSGTGLGKDFATSLARNLTTAFKDFGRETITSGSHIEKLGLLSSGVGRDHLSDFTANLIKGFLLQYTETFALARIRPEMRRIYTVNRVSFDYETKRWKSKQFELPYYNNDFVLLTPKEILTRDEAWINQGDMLSQFTQICLAIPDDSLRAQANEHFFAQITKRTTEKERKTAALRTIEKFHELLDYYVKEKEANASEAHSQSNAKVKETQKQFVENIKALVNGYLSETDFYSCGTSYVESLKRVQYLKHVIEDKGGHRLFYVNGKPIQRETDLHIMYRLTWFNTDLDVNAEVNNGRGPVDYKISKGKADASLVEFKLAKNTGLEKNLQHQVKIYEKASDASVSIKAILYFSEAEHVRVVKILNKLQLNNQENVVLIDASLESKVSASKASTS
ncbi:MAG: hypothetical protein B7Y41_06280 [Hydrogenophilales bacterium 28-61-23]|nr:MAG: hypothetical protein B7Y41_06280 [Hydrogenophilales bacterium 28-61-23]